MGVDESQQKFCFAVYHAPDGSWTYCGGREDDHPACGHFFQREHERECGCGKTHPYPAEYIGKVCHE